MNLWSLVRLAQRIPRAQYENPYFDPDKPHHTREGFRNNHPVHPPAAADLMRFRREMSVWKHRPAPSIDLSPVAPDLAFLRANRSEPTITWIGHSTVLFQIAGRNILTDPIFSERASPLAFAGPRRHQPPGIALADLPPIDLVVISHSHYDHLDRRSVRALCRQAGGPPAFAVPLGLERWFRRRVPRASVVVALDWWNETKVAGLRLALVPVHHWSARTPWDRNRNLWGAWVIEGSGCKAFFSGDIAYSRDVAEVGRRYGPFDIAAIAIGHYEPRWMMSQSHINPEEAVRIHLELRARRSLGIHWGTFERLTAEPLDQPPRDLALARRANGVAEEDFFLLRHGETRRLAAAPAAS
jgi:L-ascorbate metabolism protein UlaG (beta-lactamase superfamily)